MKKIVIVSPKHGRFEVLVDDDDYDRCKVINWSIYKSSRRRTCYAMRWVKNVKRPGATRVTPVNQYIHHFLIPKITGMVIDHVDGNGLNNQRSNLRVCTQRQNLFNRRISIGNSSGYRGVHFCKREQKWVAAISIDGKKKFLGYFKTAHTANKVWSAKAQELRKAFHRED